MWYRNFLSTVNMMWYRNFLSTVNMMWYRNLLSTVNMMLYRNFLSTVNIRRVKWVYTDQRVITITAVFRNAESQKETGSVHACSNKFIKTK